MRTVVLSLLRVNLRASAPSVLGGTLAEHLAFVFAAVQLDAIVDWGLVSRQLGAMPAPLVGALFAALAWSWARAVGRVLPRPAWVRPLPLAPAERAAVVAGPALVAAAPIFAVASLYPVAPGFQPAAPFPMAPGFHPAAPSPVAPGFQPGVWLFAAGVAAWVPILAVRGRLAPAAALAIALGPLLSVAPLMGAVLALPAAGRAIDAATPIEPRRRAAPTWLFRGRLRAQVGRDGVLAARLAPWSAAALLLQAVPAWGAERAVAADGSHELGAIVILSLAAMLVVTLLGQVALALGARFDPPEWPLSPTDRMLALAASAAAGLLPTWLAVVLAAPRGVIAASAAAVALAFGAAWVVASDRRGIEGRFLWWAMGVVAAGVAAPLAPALLAPLAAWRASRALAKGRGC